jgi:hypothetical protein
MTPDPRLDELLNRWHTMQEQGHFILPAELCRDTPELLGAFMQYLDMDLSVRTAALPPGGPVAPASAWAHVNLPPGMAGAAPALPGYEILGELGRGAMGVVYLARHLQLQRLVALKMILHGTHADAEDVQRFRNEAEAVARLQHPHIVQIYEIGDYQGLPYCALEYCAGGNLQRRLNGTPLQPREAAQLSETLARAMHAAHQKQIVHPDHQLASFLKLLACEGLEACCVELGQHGDAAVALEAVGLLADKDGRRLHKAAVLLARCVPLAMNDSDLPADQRHKLAATYTGQTIALLKRAAANGYRDLGGLKTDPAFIPLRERDDFQALLREWEKSS